MPRARAEGWSWGTAPHAPHLAEPYAQARAWLDDWLGGAAMRPLYVYGPPGGGKTGLAWCLARSELEHNGAPEFLNVRRWLRDQRAG